MGYRDRLKRYDDHRKDRVRQDKAAVAREVRRPAPEKSPLLDADTVEPDSGKAGDLLW